MCICFGDVRHVCESFELAAVCLCKIVSMNSHIRCCGSNVCMGPFSTHVSPAACRLCRWRFLWVGCVCVRVHLCMFGEFGACVCVWIASPELSRIKNEREKDIYFNYVDECRCFRAVHRKTVVIFPQSFDVTTADIKSGKSSLFKFTAWHIGDPIDSDVHFFWMIFRSIKWIHQCRRFEKSKYWIGRYYEWIEISWVCSTDTRHLCLDTKSLKACSIEWHPYYRRLPY